MPTSDPPGPIFDLTDQAGETVDQSPTDGHTVSMPPVGNGQVENIKPNPARSTRVPRFLGEYEILSEIARGGMGVVYKARQVKLDRIVALKLVRDPSLATYADLRRFQVEAEAVGQLDHPNIVPIYEVGQVDDQPYFSMKLIEGGNLSKHIERLKDEPSAVAVMMVKLARAVHYAHQRAILHRDLKPSNVLIDDHDEPYVTDFGLAKRIESGGASGETMTGAVMGTPAYMPPEQAGGGTKSVTTAADIYSLGATLYETLTGRPPFLGGSVAETLRLVLDQEPPGLRSLNPKIDRDLETICLKCLEKEPSRRFGSAELMAAELENWLDGRPLTIRPVTSIERLKKWARRRPEIAALAGTVLVVVVAGFAGVTWQWHNTTVALTRLKRSLYVADMQLGSQAFANRQFARVEQLVNDHVPKGPGDEDLRGFEWYYLHAVSDMEPMKLVAHKAATLGLSFSPDDSTFATTGMDRTARLWSTATGREVAVFSGHTDIVAPVSFHPDGRRLATGSYDRTARLWDLATGRPIHTFGPYPEAITGLAFSPDGRTLVLAGSDYKLRFLDLETRVPWHVEDIPLPQRKQIQPGDLDVHFNHAGTLLIIGGGTEGRYISWAFDGITGRLLQEVQGRLGNPLKGGATSPPFTSDGKHYLLGTPDGLTKFETETGSVVDRFVITGPGMEFFALTDRERVLVTTSNTSGQVHFWDCLPGHRKLRSIQIDRGVATNGRLTISHDGRTLAYPSLGGVVYLWHNLLGTDKVSTLPIVPSTQAGQQQLRGLSLDRSGKTLAVARQDGRLTLVDLEGRKVLRSMRGSDVPVYVVHYRPDGRAIAAGSADGHVRVWNPDDGSLLKDLRLRDLERSDRNDQVLAVAFDTTGHSLVAGDDDGWLTSWDADDGRYRFEIRRAHEAPIAAIAFSPDGSTLASAGGDRKIQLRDADSGKLRRTLVHDPARSNAGPFHSVTFSPDGREIVAACDGGIAVVWGVGGNIRLTLTGHVGPVFHAAFSPDGKRIITAGGDGRVKIWDTVLGTEIYELRCDSPLTVALLTPEGDQLVAADWDGVLTFWDGRPIRRIPGQGPVVDRK